MAKFVKAANKRPLRGGIEQVFAVPLGTLFPIILVFGHGTLKWVLAGLIVVIWSILAYGNSKDYILWTVLIRYFFQQDYYTAHTSERKLKKKVMRFNPKG